jgi:hypothetical protein
VGQNCVRVLLLCLYGAKFCDIYFSMCTKAFMSEKGVHCTPF